MKKTKRFFIALTLVAAFFLLLYAIAIPLPKLVKSNRIKADERLRIEDQRDLEEFLKVTPVFDDGTLVITKHLAESEEPIDTYRFQIEETFIEITAPSSVEESFVKVCKLKSTSDYYDYTTLAKCSVVAEALDTRLMDEGERTSMESAFMIADETLKNSTKLSPGLGEQVIGALRKVATRHVSMTNEPEYCQSVTRYGYRGDSIVRSYEVARVNYADYEPAIRLVVYDDNVLLTYGSERSWDFRDMAKYWDGSKTQVFVEKDGRPPQQTELPEYVIANLDLLNRYFLMPGDFYSDAQTAADVKKASHLMLSQMPSTGWQEIQFGQNWPFSVLGIVLKKGIDIGLSPTPNTSGDQNASDSPIADGLVVMENAEQRSPANTWSYTFNAGASAFLSVSKDESGLVTATYNSQIGMSPYLNMEPCDLQLTIELSEANETLLTISQETAKKVLRSLRGRFSLPKECKDALNAIIERRVAIDGFDSRMSSFRERFEYSGRNGLEFINWEDWGIHSYDGTSEGKISIDIAVTPDSLYISSDVSDETALSKCRDLALKFGRGIEITAQSEADDAYIDESIRWLVQRLKYVLQEDMLQTRPWSRQELLRFIHFVEGQKTLHTSKYDADVFRIDLREELGLPITREF